MIPPTLTKLQELEEQQVDNHHHDTTTSNDSPSCRVLDCMPLGKIQLEVFLVDPWELVQKDLEKRQEETIEITKTKLAVNKQRKLQSETRQELETLQFLLEFQKREEQSRRKIVDKKLSQQEKKLFEERQQIEKQLKILEQKETDLATLIQQEQAIQKVKDLERKQTQQLCQKKQQKLQKQKDSEILEVKKLQKLEEKSSGTEAFKDTWLGSLGYCLTEVTDCYHDHINNNGG